MILLGEVRKFLGLGEALKISGEVQSHPRRAHLPSKSGLDILQHNFNLTFVGIQDFVS